VTFAKDNAANNGFNIWTINGVAFAMDPMTRLFRVQEDRRYRLHMRNASDDVHPLHLVPLEIAAARAQGFGRGSALQIGTPTRITSCLSDENGFRHPY
jgi:FtsP/CotA-like multicopper oxidase with cupredoxin domain